MTERERFDAWYRFKGWCEKDLIWATWQAAISSLAELRTERDRALELLREVRWLVANQNDDRNDQLARIDSLLGKKRCDLCSGDGWLPPSEVLADGSYYTSRPCPRCSK